VRPKKRDEFEVHRISESFIAENGSFAEDIAAAEFAARGDHDGITEGGIRGGIGTIDDTGGGTVTLGVGVAIPRNCARRKEPDICLNT
jgi:hypothetical protein